MLDRMKLRGSGLGVLHPGQTVWVKTAIGWRQATLLNADLYDQHGVKRACEVVFPGGGTSVFTEMSLYDPTPAVTDIPADIDALLITSAEYMDWCRATGAAYMAKQNLTRQRLTNLEGAGT